MTLIEAVKSCFRQYVSWKGRAPRSEYWFFILAQIIALVVAAILDNVLGTTFSVGARRSGTGYIYTLAVLAFILPSISVFVRRLHDTNRSGWWYWLGLVPLVGGIILLVWSCQRGTVGSNRFGPDPLGSDTDEVFS